VSAAAAWIGAAALVVLSFRFFLHSAPDYAASLEGSAMGTGGAILMIVPLAYSVAKRVFGVRGTRLRLMLEVHIFSALAGAIFAVVHTGHKFDNPLGVLLTAVMLVVVASGFVGRYLLRHCSRALGEKRQAAARVSAAVGPAREALAAALAARPRRYPGIVLWIALVAPVFVIDPALRGAAREARRLADAAATVEASLALHDVMQTWFRRWMSLHFILTAVFYALLAAHVLAVTYYGLRWWPR
jgi:hypothetical protein